MRAIARENSKINRIYKKHQQDNYQQHRHSKRRKWLTSASALVLTVLAAGCSGSGGGGVTSSGTSGGGTGDSGGSDVGFGSPAPLPPVTADDGGAGWEGLAAEVLNSPSFQYQNGTEFGISRVYGRFNNPAANASVSVQDPDHFEGSMSDGSIQLNDGAPENDNPYIMANFHFARVVGVDLDGTGQTIALIGQTIDTDWDEFTDKEAGEIVIHSASTVPRTFNGLAPGPIGIGASGFHDSGDNRALVLMVGGDNGDSEDDNSRPHVGLIPKARAHFASYLSFDHDAFDTDIQVNTPGTVANPILIGNHIGWENYERVTAATLDAIVHNAIYQGNDWYANKGIVSVDRDAGGNPRSFSGHLVKVVLDTQNFVSLGIIAPRLANVPLAPTRADVVQKRQSDPTLSFEQAISEVIADTADPSGILSNSQGSIDTTAPDSSGWESYIDAVEVFGRTGIVGWALEERFPTADLAGTNSHLYSDNPQDTSAPVMAALPEQYADLEPFWIAVGGMSAAFDDDGTITAAERTSGSCHETASYCLMAPGNARFQEFGTDTRGNNPVDSESQAGNKVPLALVGSAVAMLNQAFTVDGEAQLSPSEIRDRLLATANNTFINKSDAGYATRDFGNGVTHAYNEEYGHGLLDVRAALEPIGLLGMPNSVNLDSGTQPIANGQVFTSAAVGNALTLSLGDTQLATFDALGAPFYIPAASLIKIDVDDANSFGDELERFAKAGSFMSSEPGDLTDGWQQAFGGAPLATLGNGFMLSPENVAIVGNYQPEKGSVGVSGGWRFHSGSTSVMAQGFGLAPVADEVFANSISILPTDGVSYGAVQVGETSSLGAFAFVEDAGGRFESTGFAFTRASALPGGGLGTLGLVMKSEDYAFMGLKSGTSETDDFSGLAGALNLSAQWNLKEDFLGDFSNSGSIFFNAEYGMAEGEGAALVQGFDTTTFSGYAVGLRFNEVLNDSDTLTFSVRQPLRVESGAANFRFSQGRDLDRNIAFNDFAASLSPEARQIDFGARYGWNVDASTRVNIGGYYSMNENHIAGEEGGAVMLAISKKL